MAQENQPAVSRFPVPELKDMPDDIRERIIAVQEKSGFIPNVFLTLAHRPDEFRAFFAYHDALMDKPGLGFDTISVMELGALLQRFRAGGYSAAAFRKFCASYERELLGTAEGRQTVEFLALLATRIPISIGCHCSDERRCHRSQLKKMIERAAMAR